jgi:hypothetical protein
MRFLISIIIFISFSAYSRQFEYSYALKLDKCVSIHSMSQGANPIVTFYDTVKDSGYFDFAFKKGPCQTVCGGGCYTTLCSPNKFYFLKNFKDSLALFDSLINLSSLIFDTSTHYFFRKLYSFDCWTDSLHPFFCIFQTMQRMYVLVIIRNIRNYSSGTIWCNSFIPDTAFIQILFEDNSMPFFLYRFSNLKQVFNDSPLTEYILNRRYYNAQGRFILINNSPNSRHCSLSKSTILFPVNISKGH